MVSNIKSPQEVYDEYITVVSLNKNLLYKKSKLKYESTELNDFEKFLDKYCPFLIKNGASKDDLDPNSDISKQADAELPKFIDSQRFTIDLPDYGNDYVAYKPGKDPTNLNANFESILHRAGWKITYVAKYPVVDSGSITSYAQFELSPIEPIKK